MRKFHFFIWVFALWLVGSIGLVYAQTGSIKGKVTDANGDPLVGANVLVKGTSLGTLVSATGEYEITKIRDGQYTIVVSFVGYKTTEQEVTVSGGQAATLDFSVEEDFLSLDDVVVTGTFNPQSKLESTVSITTLDSKMIQQQAPRSTGDLIDAIPGFYVESNLGEGANNVYPRGLPIGTGSFRYTALREDGLNSFEVSDKVFFNADSYTKVDLTVDRMEGVRGGNSVIFSSNTPGGIINFVSKTGGPELRGDVKYSYGTQGMYRADFNIGGPLTEDKKWRFNIGGFYRTDRGLRDFTGPANQGGQVKLNLTRLFDNNKGHFRIYGKVLQDRFAFWTPVTYTNFDRPEQISGGPRLQYGTFIPSSVGEVEIPDPQRSSPGNPQFRRINPANSTDVRYRSIGTELKLDLGDGWNMLYQGRFVHMAGQSNSTQVIANPTGGGNLLLNALAFPSAFTVGPGGITFNYTPFVRYTNPAIANQGFNYQVGAFSGETINPASLGAITPLPGATQALQLAYLGSLGIPNSTNGINTNGINQNGLLLPLGMFVVTGVNQNFLNNLQFSKQVGNHSLTFGGYLSAYNSDEYWNFNTLLTDVSSNPRLVDISFTGNGLQFDLTRGGVLQSNFQYEQSNSRNITYAGFIGDEWKATENLTINLGFRYEVNQATGFLQNTGRRDGRTAGFVRAGSPTTVGMGGSGGLDGNAFTLYDNNSDIPLQTFTPYDVKYEVWGANIGANYKINESSAVFLNASRGTRYATSPNFLANKDQGRIAGGTLVTAANVGTVGLGNNFNVGSTVGGTVTPINLRNPIEEILQGEVGYRLSAKKFGLTVAGFFSQLTNAPFTLQSTDPATGNIQLDVLLYDVRNYGMEAEFIVSLMKGLRVNGSLSLQNPVYTKYPELIISEVDPRDFPAQGDAGFVSAATPQARRIDVTNNKVEWIPSVQGDLTLDYTVGKFNLYANMRYVGDRWANRRNTYKLRAFTEFGAGASYRLNKFTLAAQATNIFNSRGQTQGNNRTQDNFGPNAVTRTDIINTGLFLLPRNVVISVQYTF